MNEEIKKIIKLMNENDLKKIKLKNKNFYIEIEKNEFNRNLNLNREVVNDSRDLKVIKSPLSGIFYTSPLPDKPNFVKEGDIVKNGDILCIIESMKVLHQIKSDSSGLVLKVIAKDKKRVEYNEDLFLFKNV